MIKYKLFKDGKGIIVDRIPKKIKANVTLHFCGADTTGFSLILKCSNGDTTYREIVNGKVKIPSGFLKESLTIIVANLDGTRKERYECEGIMCTTESDFVWVMPEGLNLPLEIAKCKQALEDVKEEYEKLYTLVMQLKSDYEGYDLI